MNLSDLKPAPFNPREIDAASIKGLGASVAEFGDISGIVWNRRNGYLVAGHQRMKVLLECEGVEFQNDREMLDGGNIIVPGIGEFPIRVVDWPDDKHKAAMVVANSQLIAGVFLKDDLVTMVDELKASDLAGLIEPLRLEELVDDMRPPVEVEQDEVPEPPKEPVTRPGDLWTMGEHRVLCGDATKQADAGRILDGQTPRLCVTDPPYGVNYDPAWRQRAAEAGHINYAARRTGDVPGDDRLDWREAYALFPGDVFYVWHAGRYAVPAIESLESCGFEVRTQIIWRKPGFVISRGHYNWQHEPCWYAVRKGANAGWIGNHSQSTVWDICPAGSDRGDLGHGTQKPVECMARPIRNHEGDVYDPFLGSGTTLIAAQQLGRRCYGIEIEPRYVDVTCQRFLNLTGESPVRESDGHGLPIW